MKGDRIGSRDCRDVGVRPNSSWIRETSSVQIVDDELPFPTECLDVSFTEHIPDLVKRLQKEHAVTLKYDRLLDFCCTLGLWNPSYPSASHVWNVASKPIQDLTTLPDMQETTNGSEHP